MMMKRILAAVVALTFMAGSVATVYAQAGGGGGSSGGAGASGGSGTGSGGGGDSGDTKGGTKSRQPPKP